MAKTKEELQEQAQLVRCYEANCGIEHPTAVQANWRDAAAKKLGQAFGFREVQNLSIAGASSPAPRPAPVIVQKGK